MNYLLLGWKNIVQAVKSNKKLFLGLILLQFLVLAFTAYISVSYQIKIFEQTQSIAAALETANYDQASIEAGAPFLEDVLTIYQSYKLMMSSIVDLGLWLLEIFLIPQSLLWILSHYLLKKESWKQLGQMWLKYVAAVFALLLPLALGSYFLLRQLIAIQIEVDYFAQIAKWLVGVLGVFYYLLLVAFAFINIISWKEYSWSFLRAAFRKIYLAVIVLIINVGLISGLVYLMYLTMNNENLFYLLVLLSLLLLLVLVISRIFWIAALQHLGKKHETNHS